MMKQAIMEKMANLTVRNDDEYGDFPTYEEINRDYEQVVELFAGIRTMEGLKTVADVCRVTIEVNGTLITELPSDFKDSEIEWVRYEAFGCLGYIYMYFEPEKLTHIIFDVWSNAVDDYFVMDVVGNLSGHELTKEKYQEFCSKHQD